MLEWIALLTLAISVALKVLTRVAAVDVRTQKSFGSLRGFFRSTTGVRDGATRVILNQLLLGWRKAHREGRLGDIPGFAPEQPEKGAGPGCSRERGHFLVEPLPSDLAVAHAMILAERAACLAERAARVKAETVNSSLQDVNYAC